MGHWSLFSASFVLVVTQSPELSLLLLYLSCSISHIDAGNVVNREARQVGFTNSISPFYLSCGMGILELSLDESPRVISTITSKPVVERSELASFVPTDCSIPLVAVSMKVESGENPI